MSAAAYRKDGYLNLYFHPWEFTDLNQPERFGIPAYVAKNSGEAYIARIKNFIQWAQAKGWAFARTCDFADSVNEKNLVSR